MSDIAQIVSAYLSNNPLPVEKVPSLIQAVTKALGTLPAETPAVPVEDSVGDDYIICLEDGKKMKMLRRYLDVNFHLTPEEYREKWGLPEDYPMVCRNYSKTRRNIAKGMGLGKTK